jgi:hypothetical protein
MVFHFLLMMTKKENPMKAQKYTEQELKFIAAVYTTSELFVKTVLATGKLPKGQPAEGFPTAARMLARARGFDLKLSKDEECVFNAILQEKRLPAGGVILVPGGGLIYSLEPDQEILVSAPPRMINWVE